jgi:CRISPR system Cascade subunit CasC
MNTQYKGKKIEFHILQSFPVTCLNRDDVGAPKTAIVGGVTRARVSSQSWKRQVRLEMQDFGIKLAVRTKYVADLVARKCKEMGAQEEMALGCGKKIATALSKDTLHFFSETEAQTLAEYAGEVDFDEAEIKDKEIIKRHKAGFLRSMKHIDGLDIALFGRMVAQATELNVEGAASFAHAISTHKASNEVEFFTALDDAKPDDNHDSGSSHMGSLEFNSATYYRYVSLDLGQLVETLGSDKDLDKAIEAFIKALYVAVPSARQNTQSGSNLWDFARIYVRRGQRLQASFDRPVVSKGEGYLKPSIEALKKFLDDKEILSGSLFGKIAQFTWGQDTNFSIDDLIEKVQQASKE